MRIKVLAGAFALAFAAVNSAGAEAASEVSAESSGVPTVTIINKGTEEGATEEANAVSVVEETEAEGVLPSQTTDETLPDPDLETDAALDADTDEATVDADPQADDASDETAAAEDAAPEPPPVPTLNIDVDLTEQTMTVSSEGDVLHTWPISSGRRGHLTPTGTFRPTWMARSWFSRQYDNAPMPHSIFFHKGVAIHGSWATRSLGRPASHGCVRLSPKNARKLFGLVSRHGKERTQIVVFGTPNFRSAPAVASRGGARQHRGAQPYVYLPPSAASGRARSVPRRAYRRSAQQGTYSMPRQPRGLFNGYGF